MTCASDVNGAFSDELDVWRALRQRADIDPTGLALVQPGSRSFSGRELVEAVDGLIALLQGEGLSGASTIAVVLPDGADGLVGMLAAFRVGACAPMDPALSASELREGLTAVSAAAVIAGAGDARACGVADELGLAVVVSEGAGWRVGSSARRRVAGGGCALLLATSATTGRSKTVPLGVTQLNAMVGNTRGWLGLGGEDRLLLLARQCHIQGIMAVLAQWLGGGSVIAPERFSTVHFEGWVRDFEPTWYACGPATHRAILANLSPGFSAARTKLRFVRSGGSMLTVELFREIGERMGLPVLNGYGLTETGALTSGDLLGRTPAGSVGRSIGPELGILGQAGELLPAGEQGEVVVRGASVMEGYRHDEGANRAAFHKGWFRTGDLGEMDAEGYLFLRGRIKEMINRGGQKVIPDEIDAVLGRHPAVVEAAAFAVPHRTLGEDVACAVVLRSPLTAAEVRAYLRPRMAAYKVPRRVMVVERIPRGSTGKPQRLELRRMAGAAGGAAGSAAGSSQSGEFRYQIDAPHLQLMAIWLRILERDAVELEEDFFEAGGDSLGAIAMLLEAEQIFDCKEPLSSETFADCPTLVGLLGQIEVAAARRVAEEERRVLHPVRNGTGAIPVFLLPAGGDTGLYLRRLARHLAPMCAVTLVRPQELGPFGTLYAIEHAAEVAASAICGAQEKGPYVVGGYCQGGIVAFATASLLEERGHAVRLVLFDTPAPPTGSGVPGAREAMRTRMEVERRTFRSMRKTVRGALRRSMWMVLRPVRPVLHRLRDVGAVRRMVAWSEPRTYWLYRPPVNRGDVLHFVATTRGKWHDRATENWRFFTRGAMQEVAVTGDHHSIFDEGNLIRMAGEMGRWMEAAGAELGLGAQNTL